MNENGVEKILICRSKSKIEKNFGNIFFKIHKYNYRKWTLVEVTKNLGGFYNLKHEVFEGQIN